MKSISLIKVTLIVIVAALVSNFVNADEEMALIVKKIPSAENQSIAFFQLISPLDRDQDGLLSRLEVLASENKLLQENFNKIDVNNNSQISEKEFNRYMVQFKDAVFFNTPLGNATSEFS